MTITVPPTVPYQSPLNPIPTYLADATGNPPPEGCQLVPCEIDWGTMGGANNACSLNVQNNQTLNFSRICALKVDNSQCGSDVLFIFPDTSEVLTIPAYSPATIFTVFTNMTQFSVSAPNAESEDVTRFILLNFVPFPASVGVSTEQETAVFGNIAATGAASTQLVPAGINGRVEAVFVAFQIPTGGGDIAQFVIEDGNGNVIVGGQVQSSAGGAMNPTPISINPMLVRFFNGLKFVIVSSDLPATSTASVNVLYRTP